MIQKISGVRRDLVPDIDRQHDEMYSSLEHLLNVTLSDLVNSGVPVPPSHLNTLARTLVACQGGRRVVHQKEQSISRKVVELRENPEVYTSFVQSLTDLASRSGNKQLSKTGEHLSLTVMDAEFEELDEAM